MAIQRLNFIVIGDLDIMHGGATKNGLARTFTSMGSNCQQD